jgi:phosphoglycolate phosphatase-like HAD superfamily hydrolase
MKLVVFDLDGTLIDINPIDDAAFVTAFREELGIDCTARDWSEFEFVTNAGIAGALLETLEEPLRPAALNRVRRRFFDLLERGSASCAFRPIRGAAAFIERLPQTDWRGVIATGCWGSSVEMKLRSSGLEGLLPFVCSDGERSREGIVRQAIALARERHGADFDRIVMIGDAPWDVRTAAMLGLPFVGIAAASAAQRLSDLGATHLLRDFSSFDEVISALESARPPGGVPGGASLLRAI